MTGNISRDDTIRFCYRYIYVSAFDHRSIQRVFKILFLKNEVIILTSSFVVPPKHKIKVVFELCYHNYQTLWFVTYAVRLPEIGCDVAISRSIDLPWL